MIFSRKRAMTVFCFDSDAQFSILGNRAQGLSHRWTGLSVVCPQCGLNRFPPGGNGDCFCQQMLLPAHFRACICAATALAIVAIGMETRHKILVLDDDVDWLKLSSEMLTHLPSKPEIRTVASGARALALLETEPFRLLICDLKMPRIDGLQVLAIVRRRFPELRTVVLSALEDEEFRSRAYALGVDLFWLKTEMQRNLQMYLDCLESLLGREIDGGFRGIQSKSLMDIIQMECLSRSSTVLRLTRGALVAKLWLQDGELIDAEAEGARGEAALRRILAWKSGTFENLPAEPHHEHTITKSVNALLLESAQAMDETANPVEPESAEQAAHRKNIWKLALLTRENAEFVVAVPAEGRGEVEALGVQSVPRLAHWTRRALEVAKRLGEHIGAGPLSHLDGNNLERQLLILPQENKSFLIGWPPDVEAGPLFEKSKKLVASWDS
jgi:CheY-like chemotaxis protein